jgi:general secretion pathway protein C
MAVSLNPRAERLLAPLRRVTVYSALELLLLVLIAVQCARLFWAVLTPMGPVGDYKALDQMRPVGSAGPALGSFDPFFRQAPGAPGSPQAPAMVTSLDIRLYGVTANQATGGGSAIIGPVNGPQRVYMVGEEIMPGVTLTGVGFDYVVISRGGATERLFMDQAPPAAANAGPAGIAPPVQVPPPQPVPVAPRIAPPAPHPG